MNPGARGLKFGTSGLRGEAATLTDAVMAAYVAAFLNHVLPVPDAGVRLVVGMDRRPSSPRIAAACLAAARALGLETEFAGILPTPALALHAQRFGWPAIMVTASHNPEADNGLKFYRPDGELMKPDEAPIRAAAEATAGQRRLMPVEPLPDAAREAADGYLLRFTEFFAPRVLSGLRLGVDLHSAAGRDMLVAVLEALGAHCIPIRRSERFIALDTEALDPGTLDLAAEAIAAHRLDAMVSTDGDGDRPLLIDATGAQVPGDTLGMLAATHLGFRHVVTPVSSVSSVEESGLFDTVARTRIGSPYVIEALRATHSRVRQPVAGFEANGGFLTCGALEWRGRHLTELVTRDAMLPMIAVLARAAETGTPVADLVASLRLKAKRSGRLRAISPEQAAALVEDISRLRRAEILLGSGFEIQSVDRMDGARLHAADGRIVHFRPSGNAPELRCYVEAEDGAAADELLALALARASDALRGPDGR